MATLLVRPSLSPGYGTFAVATLEYAIFNFVSRGCGFAYDQSKFTFDYNTSRDYKCLGEGSIFFYNTPLPRIQERISIYIYIYYIPLLCCC